jgi:lysozyme
MSTTPKQHIVQKKCSKQKPVTTKRKRRAKNNFNYFTFVVIAIVVICFAGGIYYFYPTIKSFIYKTTNPPKDIEEIISEQSKYSVFGIDVSKYQAVIDWDTVVSNHKIDFVFVRASAGKNKVDQMFEQNWTELHKRNIICGAYHYFRPDENSTAQAEFFIKNVKLSIGDLPPVLDIEKISKVQSMESLKVALLNWLKIIELYYKVTPILYTYNNYYTQWFKNDPRFDKYLLWLAWYDANGDPNTINSEWIFWQFTDNGKIKGIENTVDVNIFNGSLKDLDGIRIKEIEIF